ncbi:MAG TPA: hypothetical protein VF642_01750 [Propionibacteriaceae bacterium]
MPNQRSEADALLLRLIGGDPHAADEVLTLAAVIDDPSVLVAAALVAQNHSYLDRARTCAVTVRDRHLVVLAKAQLEHRSDLFDALVRDHLADHPDHLLAAWIAGRQHD